MGSVDKADAHQGVFRAEELGVDQIQLIPAQVIIPIAGGAGKIPLRHPVIPEGGQHPLGVVPGDGVYVGKLFPQRLFRLAGKGADSLRYLQRHNT